MSDKKPIPGGLIERIEQAMRDWSPESHLGALTDRPVETSGKIVRVRGKTRFPSSSITLIRE